MNITDVKFRSVRDEGRMKAIVSVTFNDELVVHDMKIIDGPERRFLAMPSRRTTEGFRDIVHPIHGKARREIENVVLEMYERFLLEQETGDRTPAEPEFPGEPE